MAQRHSEYPRQDHERYTTPSWPVAALAPWLLCRGVRRTLDVDYADDTMSRHLSGLGFDAVRGAGDFLGYTAAPAETQALIVNPPYGVDRGGRLAVAFIRHALNLNVRIVAALVKIDFDSGSTRTALFRDCPTFAGKLVLLRRIVWFSRPGASPSDNHCWLLWDRQHRGPPQIFYPASASPDVAP
jgi:hypothetical protein